MATTNNPRVIYCGRSGRYQNCQWLTYDFSEPDVYRRYPHVLNVLARHVMSQIRGLHESGAVVVSMQYHLVGAAGWIDGGHSMTQSPGHSLTNVRIECLNDLLRLLGTFLADRENLDERYSENYFELSKSQSPASTYMAVARVRFRLYIPIIIELIGDRQSHLMQSALHQNAGTPGACLWNAIRHQNSKRPDLTKVTDDDFMRQTGIGSEGIKVRELEQVEQRFVHRNRRGVEDRLNFVVFDCRFNLLRLPPMKPKEQQNRKYYTMLVLFNNHFYSPKSPQLGVEMMKRGLGLIEAWFDDQIKSTPEQTKKRAYDLFRTYQTLLPDRHAFHRAIRNRIGGDPQAHRKYLGLMKYAWKPGRAAGDAPPGSRHIVKSPVIKALGFPETSTPTLDPMDEAVTAVSVIESHPAIVTRGDEEEGRFAPSMENVVVFDIETLSTEEEPGRFLTYAVEWRSSKERRLLEAQTVGDLGGRLIWTAVQDFLRLAASSTEKPFYVYAYNGSRFDNIAVIYEILARSKKDVPTDPLETNGKMIRFEYNGLVFVDLCLITMSSLRKACNSYGIVTQKGDFPHRLLQNLPTKQHGIDMLNAVGTWADLEPFLDWFAECSPEDLQKRNIDEADDWVEKWKRRMKLWQYFDEHRDDKFDVRKEMRKYLRDDVDALWELVDKVGSGLTDLGCDIRKQCTVGSCATRIWQYTLEKDVPKLLDEDLARRWADCNRGGLCGPLGRLDWRRDAKRRAYKVDITSLYPSSCRNVEYIDSDGQAIKPIDPWWQSFPDPTKGWKRHDFCGQEMTTEHRRRLETMYGSVRVRFDQSRVVWPSLLKKMTCGPWQTLTYVLEGEERYTIPQIMHAFDRGARIWLRDCDYTTACFNPFHEYMHKFEKIKNDADLVKKELETVAARTPEEVEGLQRACYDREIAKLFLNSLLGRLNMKVDRTQHVITRSADDVVTAVFNDERFGGNLRDVQEEEIQCGDQTLFRLKFKEGDYYDHVYLFNVAPYLSAYMLGYSKILMAENMFCLKGLGAELLYTDTDSIIFAASEEQYERYASRFVPPQKTFGGMELEGVYNRVITIGPKKYICVGDDYYEYKANGIPARHNTERDLLAVFERVLEGKEVGAPQEVGYFSIKAQSNFTLKHTSGATKRLRFIMLKGSLDEDDTLCFWKNEGEFESYASNLRSIGVQREDEEEVRTALPPMTEEFVVYLLTDASSAATYFGKTTDLDRRLREHNGEVSGGAQITARDRPWRVVAKVVGFGSAREALQFEWQAQHLRPRNGPADAVLVLRECANMKKWRRHLRVVAGGAGKRRLVEP